MPDMNSRSRRKGSIFVLALWTVSFLSFFAVIMGANARMRLHAVRKLTNRDLASTAVESGLYEIRANMIKKNKAQRKHLFKKVISVFKVLPDKNNEGGPESMRYNYLVELNGATAAFAVNDEQARLNINKVDAHVLTRLLKQTADLYDDQAQELAFSIVDWRDSDNERPGLQVINNEDLFYTFSDVPYKPKNRRFEYVEEVMLVPGITPELFLAIRGYITVFGSGTVNLNTCSKVVLKAFGLDDELAQKIIATREQQAQDTASAECFLDTNAVIEQINAIDELDDDEVAALEDLIATGWVDTDTDFFRIRGFGFCRGDRVGLHCVMRRNGIIKHWFQG